MSRNGTMCSLLTDQLGSTSITTDSSGNKVSELRYDAWGSVRYTSGSTPTDYTYTRQYSNVADFGLMYYIARWYDPTIARFAQADTIVTDGVQGYDRYAYANNAPTTYADPSGHAADAGGSGAQCPASATCRASSSGGTSTAKNRNARSALGDAGYLSFSISAGIGPLYGAWSVDAVATDDEIGIFTVGSLGPGVENQIQTLPSTIDTSRMEETWMTPQIGAAVYGGRLWGPSLREAVLNYQGTSKIAGASLGPEVALAGEYFESVDRYTGRLNGQIRGVGVGFGVGAVPIEGHLIYGDAVYHPQMSTLATGLYQTLGLLPNR